MFPFLLEKTNLYNALTKNATLIEYTLLLTRKKEKFRMKISFYSKYLSVKAF